MNKKIDNVQSGKRFTLSKRTEQSSYLYVIIA